MARTLEAAPLNDAPMAGGIFSRAWHRWFDQTSKAVNERLGRASSYVLGNVVLFDADGNASDSGKAPPAGQFVGTEGAQTLYDKTLVLPVLDQPFIDDFTNAPHDHQGEVGGGQLDHGAALVGLEDDDHAQYLLLEGRAGGQAAVGGTGESENLVLESTSNAAKGDVQVKSRLRFSDSGIAWRDAIVPGVSLGAGASTPDLVPFLAAGGLRIRAFDGGALTEQLFGSIDMQHDYQEGTDLIPHIHWTPTTAGAGNVVWQLEYSWQNPNGTFGASTTVAVTGAANGSAWVHEKAAFPAISGAGKLIGSAFVFRLFRDPANAGDSYAGDAGLIDFGIHYRIDTAGSRQAGEK